MAFDPGNPVYSIDYVLIAGEKTPGIATLEGASSPRQWDAVRGYGMSGFYPRFTGNGLAEFTIVIQLLTPEDFAAWEAFVPLVQRPPDTTYPRAYDIAHPLLDQLQIYAVVVKDVTQIAVDDSGLGTVRITCLQHRKPKPQYAKPDAATQDDEPTPKTRREKLMHKLANQVEVAWIEDQRTPWR